MKGALALYLRTLHLFLFVFHCGHYSFTMKSLFMQASKQFDFQHFGYTAFNHNELELKLIRGEYTFYSDEFSLKGAQLRFYAIFSPFSGRFRAYIQKLKRFINRKTLSTPKQNLIRGLRVVYDVRRVMGKVSLHAKSIGEYVG
jgi:hypothetical protein